MKIDLESDGHGEIFKDLLNLGSLSDARRHDDDHVVRVLGNGAVSISVVSDGEFQEIISKGIINCRLEKISGNDKDQG